MNTPRLPDDDAVIREVNAVWYRDGPMSAPDDARSHRVHPAPWELILLDHADTDHEYSAWRRCGRCLRVAPLGHAVTITADGEPVASCGQDRNLPDGEKDYLTLTDDDLTRVTSPDVDTVIDVDPSIGCQLCGFHVFVNDGRRDVLSDWTPTLDLPTPPAVVYANRWDELAEYRPSAIDRLRNAGYPDPSTWDDDPREQGGDQA